MKIDAILNMGATKSLIYMEKHVNKGSPSGFTNQNKVLGNYAPRLDDPISIYCIRTSMPMLEFHIMDCSIKSVVPPGVFLVHPAIINSLDKERITSYEVVGEVPAYVTASGRTVLALFDTGASFIKLHYPDVLGRVYRHLPLRKAVAGVEISNSISRLILDSKLGQIGLLPEIRCCGISRSGLDDSISFVERATNIITPKGIDTTSYLIPGFSMFSLDDNNSLDKPILIQLCDDFSIDTIDSFFECFISPIIYGYLSLSVTYGLMPEINAQNILFAVDFTNKKIYPVLRDMGRVEKLLYINKEYVNYYSYPYKTIDSEDIKYGLTRHSFSFDFKLTNYVIEPMIDMFVDYYYDKSSKTKKLIYEKASNIIDAIPNAREWLPLKRKVMGHPKMILTQERPYIEIGEPLIR